MGSKSTLVPMEQINKASEVTKIPGAKGKPAMSPSPRGKGRPIDMPPRGTGLRAGYQLGKKEA